MKKLKPYEGWLDIVQKNHVAIPIHCITEELPADDEYVFVVMFTPGVFDPDAPLSSWQWDDPSVTITDAIEDKDIKLLDYGLALWWISAVEVSEAFNKAFEPTHLSEFAQYVAMQYLEQLATDKEAKKE